MCEHAVIVHLLLSESADIASFHSLEDEIAELIDLAEAGEFDGDEFGGGECTLYMYGPDADRLFDAVESVLRASILSAGGYAIKRYGAASDAAAREARVELGPA